MNWNNKQPSAFPFSTESYTEFGMTLRDYFAAKAMQGFIGTTYEEEMEFDEVALAAYKYADSMLKAREA
jgi:hypothetical protein